MELFVIRQNIEHYKAMLKIITDPAQRRVIENLLSREHGSEKVRDMIVDDIREAQWSGNKEHVTTLLHVLHHFLLTHPEARPSEHPWSHRF